MVLFMSVVEFDNEIVIYFSYWPIFVNGHQNWSSTEKKCNRNVDIGLKHKSRYFPNSIVVLLLRICFHWNLHRESRISNWIKLCAKKKKHQPASSYHLNAIKRIGSFSARNPEELIVTVNHFNPPWKSEVHCALIFAT